MVSRELLRSCARVRSSLANSAGILFEASAIDLGSPGILRITLLRMGWFDSRGQPVDISVVPLKKGACRFFLFPADMAELADALGSGPSGRKVVEVRVLLSAPKVLWLTSSYSFKCLRSCGWRTKASAPTRARPRQISGECCGFALCHIGGFCRAKLCS